MLIFHYGPAHAALDVGIDHAPVDERCEAVHEEHGEHCALRIAGVIATDHHCYGADQEAVDVFADVSATGSHRVGCHEDDGEEETSEHDLGNWVDECVGIDRTSPVPGHEAHQQSSCEGGEDDAPVGYTCKEKDSGADDDAEGRSLAPASGIEAEEDVGIGEHMPEGIGDMRSGVGRSELSKRCGSRETVDGRLIAEAYEHMVAAHLRRIAEEEERTGHKSHIEEVIACAPKHFFGEDHCESHCHSKHPAGSVDRANHRNEDTRNEETFLDFVAADLRHDEFDAQAHDVGCENLRKHSEEAVEE